MKNSSIVSTAAALVILANPFNTALAETSQGAAGPQPQYRVDNSIDFDVGNSTNQHFLFSWTDTGLSPSNKKDPRLVLVEGVSYGFFRTSGSHPFFIMGGSMPVRTNSDGTLRRNFKDQATLDSHKLTAGATNGSPIFWTPPGVGTYYYTCGIPGHDVMTGRIDVVASINHSAIPRPFVKLDGRKTIRTSKKRVTLRGLSSGTKVNYTYRGNRRISKNKRVAASGKWRVTIKPTRRRTVVKLKADFKGVKSRPTKAKVISK